MSCGFLLHFSWRKLFFTLLKVVHFYYSTNDIVYLVFPFSCMMCKIASPCLTVVLPVNHTVKERRNILLTNIYLYVKIKFLGIHNLLAKECFHYLSECSFNDSKILNDFEYVKERKIK